MLVISMFACLVACESLEDTYSDYTGDGPINYPGKCLDLNVVSGWNRLTVTWKNSVDPSIERIRLTCEEGVTRVVDTILPYDAERCDIFGLADGNYAIKVFAENGEGQVSVSDVVYGRPYTYEHESVRGFTPGVMKHFFVKDNVVLFFSVWDENIAKFELNYTGKSDRLPKSLLLDSLMFAEEYYLVEDVDVSQPVKVVRQGLLTGCPDTILFEDYVLEHEALLQTDFRVEMTERYGETQFDSEFFNRTELELDYDLSSFEDVLYFSNLKKLILGKNRYHSTTSSVLQEMDKSLFCLSVAQELLGLEVVRYDSHYLPVGTEGITEAGDSELPQLEYVSSVGWTVENSLPDEVGNFSSEALFDNNPSTLWEANIGSYGRIFELTIDMKNAQRVNGVQITQGDVNGNMVNFLPILIEINVSADGQTWESPTNVVECTLGCSPGEITLVRFRQAYEGIRYVRLTVKDQLYGNNYGSLLGDVAVF